jgi:uncharacterized protein (TIGR03083 family)
MRDETAALRAERQSLLDLASSLTITQWDHPSLCEHWRVRDVVAHANLLVSVSRPQLVLGVLRFGGNVNRYMARTVPKRGNQAPAVHLEDSAKLVASDVIAPMGRRVESAIDAFVHQLDIAVPLERPMVADPERLRWMADGMVSTGGAIDSRRRVTGLRLVATDIDWHYGTGPEVVGPAAALLLAGCGRSAFDPQLTGPGVDELVARR